MLVHLVGNDRHSCGLDHLRQAFPSSSSPKLCILMVNGQPQRQCHVSSALPGAGRGPAILHPLYRSTREKDTDRERFPKSPSPFAQSKRPARRLSRTFVRPRIQLEIGQTIVFHPPTTASSPRL
jgi:hypothetical protein